MGPSESHLGHPGRSNTSRPQGRNGGGNVTRSTTCALKGWQDCSPIPSWRRPARVPCPRCARGQRPTTIPRLPPRVVTWSWGRFSL
eukprot:7523194-Pyramimonas_sp.AAC.1